jgi:nitrate/nitrite-specific signal transduction histidine kinase
MADRAGQIGADFVIVSKPNQGTEVSLHWALEKSDDE